MALKDLKILDVIPDSLLDKYPQSVLEMSMNDARHLIDLFQRFSSGAAGSSISTGAYWSSHQTPGSAYWSDENGANSAYWSDNENNSYWADEGSLTVRDLLELALRAKNPARILDMPLNEARNIIDIYFKYSAKNIPASPKNKGKFKSYWSDEEETANAYWAGE